MCGDPNARLDCSDYPETQKEADLARIIAQARNECDMGLWENAVEILDERLNLASIKLSNAYDEISKLKKELESLRAFKHSVDEALNSGDGAYRP